MEEGVSTCILELRESHRHHGSSHPCQVSVGDDVTVHFTDQPRSFRKLGRVKRFWQDEMAKSKVRLYKYRTTSHYSASSHSTVVCIPSKSLIWILGRLAVTVVDSVLSHLFQQPAKMIPHLTSLRYPLNNQDMLHWKPGTG